MPRPPAKAQIATPARREQIDLHRALIAVQTSSDTRAVHFGN